MDSRVCCLGVVLSFLVTPYIFGVDGCSMFFQDACKDVECPNGNKCTSFSSYWCANRTGSVCLPRGRCDKNHPCKTAKCSSKEKCVLIIDDCKKIGGYNFHSQCNEMKRKGSCPNPDKVRSTTTSCANTCDDDSTCETGAKCCPGGPFGNVCVHA